MDCSRLDYYLNKICIDAIDKDLISEFDDFIENKIQKNLKLKSLAGAAAIASKVVTVVNLTPYLNKGMSLNFFEMYEEVKILSLEDKSLTIDLPLQPMFDEIGTLIDGIDLAIDGAEAVTTLGLSLAATWLAKKASDKLNEEKEVVFKQLEFNTKIKRDILKILSTEKSYLARQQKLSSSIKNIRLNQVI